MATSPRSKLSYDDFSMGGILGEGAYAKVLLGTRKEDGKQFAVKMVDKLFIQKHKKIEAVMNEKRVLSLLNHPCIIRLHYTFQTKESLFYVLELAQCGELFEQIQRIGKYELDAGTFYSAEMVCVLEYLHSKGVVHRDLKPENILIAENRHLKLTDFGTSKILSTEQLEGGDGEERTKSFVGTAEYVSPEVLNDEVAGFPADMWALGCIIFQMLVGKPPFRGDSEYLTFQKILNREVGWPAEALPEAARDLIDHLLQLDPAKRLGSTPEGYQRLKEHPFFEGIAWDTIHTQEPPVVVEPEEPPTAHQQGAPELSSDEGFDLSEEELEGRASICEAPSSHGAWAQFLQGGETIVYTGLVTKRRRPFTKKRQLILTDHPRLIYIDDKKMVLRGEIPWTPKLWAELKNPRTFYIHTDKRSYYMQGLSSGAKCWVDWINQTQKETKDKADKAAK